MFIREKRKMKKVFVMLLILAVMAVSTGGCGAVENGDSSGAMGRYVEETTDLSDKISGHENALYQLSNGNLVISDRYRDFMKTGDNGAVWMTDKRNWRTKMMEDGIYIMSLAIGADNTVALICHIEEEEETEREVSEESEEASEEDVQKNENENADSTEFEDFELNPQLFIIKPDNTQIHVDMTITDNNDYLYQTYIADNGRIFVSMMGSSNLYEVKEDGSSELFLTLEESRPEIMQFQGNLMLLDGYGYQGPLLYDMERKEYIEDEVLKTFVLENYSGRQYDNPNRYTQNCYDLYYFFAGEDVLYLAGSKGLYRHVIGGSVMEQIIDGSLCTLGNPSYRLQGMLALEDNEFLALYEGGKAVRYYYDATVPTVPTEKLTVYALRDNETIRQAISIYQAQHPNAYVDMELGFSGGSSVTKDDALKSLNTKIMAGEGPDVLILDDMPIDSYIEKGLLEDLSPFIDSLSGEEVLFQNIVDAVKSGDNLYTMPCEVRLPVMMADKKYASQMKDIAGIADAAEMLRDDNPGKDIFGFCSEKGIMRVFSMACVPAWITESGELDKEAVTEFLKQTKRIYDAQMAGIDDQIVEEYQGTNDYYAEYVDGAVSYDDTDDVRTGTDYMSYLGGIKQTVCGVIDSLEPYMGLTSVQRVEDFRDAKWITMKGQSGNVFWAQTVMGISTASENKEQAQDFIRTCLGKENQLGLYYGLPVNQEAFEKRLVPKEGEVDSDGVYGACIVSNDEGLYVHLTWYWPDEKQMDDLRNCLKGADTVYIKNDILESAVYEEGITYIQGTQSLEEAVSAIEKKISIYMAE